MTLRRILVPLLCAGLGAAADSAAQPAKPWSESFTMTLKDSERTFVVANGASFLQIDASDLQDRDFIAGKDVMLPAKFERADAQFAHFYNLPLLEAVAPAELWATRLDGDNVFVFGRLAVDETGKATLTVDHLADGPSDNQVIADRLAAVPESDFEGRLKIAEWAREQAAKQGNRDLWTAAADTIVAQVVENAAKQAADAKDAKLLLRAVDWSLALIHDRALAARICSSEWVRAAGDEVEQQIGERMKRLDYVFYKDAWRPKAEALQLEFDDRFNETKWRDADGYYKLGRWAQANVELLPRARELAHRSFQAGFRADPRHNGIRRELGMEPAVGGTARSATLAGPFQDADNGVIVDAPEAWQRSEPIDGDATWIDPQSDTAYITVSVLSGNQLKSTFDELWTSQTARWTAKDGYEKLDEQPVSFDKGTGRRQTFAYREARYPRQADLVVLHNAKANVAVVVVANYTEAEKEDATKALSSLLGRIVIPDAYTAPNGGASGSSGNPGGNAAPTQPPASSAQPPAGMMPGQNPGMMPPTGVPPGMSPSQPGQPGRPPGSGGGSQPPNAPATHPPTTTHP